MPKPPGTHAAGLGDRSAAGGQQHRLHRRSLDGQHETGQEGEAVDHLLEPVWAHLSRRQDVYGRRRRHGLRRTTRTSTPSTSTAAPPITLATGNVSASTVQPAKPTAAMPRGHRCPSPGSVHADALAIA